ncbi:putative retroelement pol polyprotein [Cucumis melo var. makuwa]|uniref:Retroelement pol polyprotein n=1 Tax=Cucumis melo var. makuwa TaxID=1194695 RepID=A0A5A7TWF0_CUCMM|nr:putative retroelement pol polyprotein [Cucumis melo var. makuwa]
MTTTKFEIEKFDGNGDFTLWTKRITAILGSQKALKALECPKELLATLTKSERETMEENKNLDENLDEFKKLTNALNQTEEKMGAESEAAILINLIHDTYKEVKIALEGKNFRRDKNIRYRPYGRKDFNQNRNYQREDRRKGREHGSDHGPVGNEAFKYTEALAATNEKAMEIETEEEDWVLDSRCTYHMTSKKNWFVDYKSQAEDSIYMGNNQDCEIIGLVLLKLSNNREVLLKGVRHVPKLKRNLISLGEHRSKATLDYVHGDLWGPARTHSWGGSRTDNALEFLSNDFNFLCNEFGISKHIIVAYTPQQNKVAERMNRTLMERVKCMILEAKISEHFWAEALAIATYTVNRSLCVSIDAKTPEERWTGATHKLSNLKLFGCTSYAYIKQSKIEPRALKYIVFKENEIYMEYIKVTPSVEQNMNEPCTSHQVEIHSNLKDSNPSSSDQLPTEALPSFHPQEEEEEENTKDLTNYSLTKDKGRRTIKPPRFARADCITNSSTDSIEDDHYSYKDALTSRHNNQWKDVGVQREADRREAGRMREGHMDASGFLFASAISDLSLVRKSWVVTKEAMNDELNSLYKNDTWKLVKKPHGKSMIPCKWVFKKKMIAHFYKNPTGLVACENLELEQLDVTTAFLHGSLEEEIFMEQPKDFEVKGKKELDLGAAKKILGIKILRDRNNNELSLIQKTYTNKVLYRFNMASSKVVSTPLAQHIKISAKDSPRDPPDKQAMSYVPYSNATGNLMYLIVCTRPDLAHSSSLVSRRKILSTTEVEFVAISEALKEAMWLRGIVSELGYKQEAIELMCDNQSAIHLTKKQQYHDRTKHIDVKLHFVHDIIEKRVVKILNVKTEENAADFLTKALSRSKFHQCLNLLNVVDLNKDE